MTVRLLTICLALAALALAACGEEAPPKEEAPPTAREGPSAVEQLAERTRELQGEVRREANRLVEEPSARAGAMQRLEELEREARRLGERATREEAAGDPLARANRRTAEAARELREFAGRRDQQLLRDARAALADAQSQLGKAIENLPPQTRQRLDDLRRGLPEVPQP